MLDLNFSSVQLLSHVRLFATPWTEACQASPYITNSQNLLKLLSLELVMPSWWHFNLNLAFIKFAIENVESLNSGFRFPVVSYQFYFYHVIPLFKSFLHCPSLRNEAFLDSSCSWLGIQMLAAFLLYRDSQSESCHSPRALFHVLWTWSPRKTEAILLPDLFLEFFVSFFYVFISLRRSIVVSW